MPVISRQRVGNTTLGTICSLLLQARRARSDAPYRVGHAIGLFDFIAHFGVRDKCLIKNRPGPCGRGRWRVEKMAAYWTSAPSRKPWRWRTRVGWRSLRKALASIWRMRSRVTLYILPISSSVRS